MVVVEVILLLLLLLVLWLRLGHQVHADVGRLGWQGGRRRGRRPVGARLALGEPLLVDAEGDREEEEDDGDRQANDQNQYGLHGSRRRRVR